jgi:hypothetical protein
VEPREVKTGRSSPDPASGERLVEIIEGLNEGDRVLAGSAGLVPAGVRVRLTQLPASSAR